MATIGGLWFLVGAYLYFRADRGTEKAAANVKRVYGVERSPEYQVNARRFSRITGLVIMVAAVGVIVFGFATDRAFG